MPICLPKWLAAFQGYSFKLGIKKKRIQTIFVDKPYLSSLYFKEYLGYRILFRIGKSNKITILIYKHRNLIMVKWNNESISKKQSIMVTTNSIENDYKALLGKVRFVKHLSSSNSKPKFFVISDCNGIDIVYKASASI